MWIVYAEADRLTTMIAPVRFLMPDEDYGESVVEKMAFIGGGQMGAAILKGSIRTGVVMPAACLVVDPDPLKREHAESLGCVVAERADAARTFNVIVLAVKPQSFADAARALGALPAGTLVISVMAGLSSSAIRAALGGSCRVIRVMPNTPCQLGAGMSAIAIGAGAGAADEKLARRMFEPIGKVIVVPEAQMYAVTATSGSGPAYVFLLAELMEEAAIELGISAADARLLVTQTVLGAARMLTETGEDAKTLRNAVTSPGGTTEAALNVMFDRHVPEVIVQAMVAAHERGRELDLGEHERR